MSELVVFKGTKDGLKVVLDGTADFSAVVAELESELARNSNFFAAGGGAAVFTSGRLLAPEELGQLSRILAGQGLALVKLETSSGEASTAKSRPTPVSTSTPVTKNGATAKVIKRTLRSGMQVRHDGDIVVLGDLNPGAEIVASGDIIVFGTLRGVVHAGATGNLSAKVVALRLAPTQLRIANLIARSPDGGEVAPERPEVARIRDGAVIIEEFAS